MLQLSLSFNLILVGCFINRDDAFLRSFLLNRYSVNIFLKWLKVFDYIMGGIEEGTGSTFGVLVRHAWFHCEQQLWFFLCYLLFKNFQIKFQVHNYLKMFNVNASKCASWRTGEHFSYKSAYVIEILKKSPTLCEDTKAKQVFHFCPNIFWEFDLQLVQRYVGWGGAVWESSLL